MKRFFKRTFDLFVAILGLLFLWPVFFLVGLLNWILLGWPVVYAQKRPGLHGKIFTIYKFRSMRNAHGPDGRELSDAERLTRYGVLLRKTSLDELPELYNVIKGEMSLVGPRPLLVEYLDRYTPEQARRHEIRPGITGWAQVNGRNAITHEEKFVLDVWYVDHWTLRLDLWIIFLTFWKVVRRSDINTPGLATTYKFGEAGAPAATAQASSAMPGASTGGGENAVEKPSPDV